MPNAQSPTPIRWPLALLVLGVLALHQDFWLWNNKTLVFGILPQSVFYHAVYCLLGAMLMWTLVLNAWPAHLDEDEPSAPAEAAR